MITGRAAFSSFWLFLSIPYLSLDSFLSFSSLDRMHSFNLCNETVKTKLLRLHRTSERERTKPNHTAPLVQRIFAVETLWWRDWKLGGLTVLQVVNVSLQSNGDMVGIYITFDTYTPHACQHDSAFALASLADKTQPRRDYQRLLVIQVHSVQHTDSKPRQSSPMLCAAALMSPLPDSSGLTALAFTNSPSHLFSIPQVLTELPAIINRCPRTVSAPTRPAEDSYFLAIPGSILRLHSPYSNSVQYHCQRPAIMGNGASKLADQDVRDYQDLTYLSKAEILRWDV